jgi:hypothetical protein
MQGTTMRSLSQRSHIVKKLFLILATVAVLLTTAAVPSRADGNPAPICNDQGCKKPLQG